MPRRSKDAGSSSSSVNEEYTLGEFSLALEQSNGAEDEDNLYVQVDTSPGALFVGIYDGHENKHASEFIAIHLLNRIIDRLLDYDLIMTGDVLKNALNDTENDFLNHVRLRYQEKNRRSFAKSGSCCLVTFVWKGDLYIGNLGDSRAILCCEKKGKMEIQQLTTDHNLKDEAVRNEFKEDNPQDPNVVVETREGTWLIKGISKVTRSIGYCYLKQPIDNFYEGETGPIVKPLISSDPEICRLAIIKEYKFLIAASGGFWDLISNEEAVDLVKNNSRTEIAKILLTAALTDAAKRKGNTYEELKKIPKGRSERGEWHDDICVVVMFFDRKGSKWLKRKNKIKNYSYRAFCKLSKTSDFERIKNYAVGSSQD